MSPRFRIHKSWSTVIHQRFHIQPRLLSMEQLYSAKCIHRLGQERAGNMVFLLFIAHIHCPISYNIKRWRHCWSLHLNGPHSCSSGAPLACYCLLKTVPKWLDDGAEKILRLDETPNLQQRAGSRNFQSTTLYWKDSQWISWIVSKVLLWPVSDSVNVVLSTAWSSFFTLMGLINFCEFLKSETSMTSPGSVGESHN